MKKIEDNDFHLRIYWKQENNFSNEELIFIVKVIEYNNDI